MTFFNFVTYSVPYVPHNLLGATRLGARLRFLVLGPGFSRSHSKSVCRPGSEL